MGEAARRKAEIAKLKAGAQTWLESLTADQRLVAEVARAAHKTIVGQLGMTEGCYNLAFFLHEFLKREYGVTTQVVIGWINDGLWKGAASHGWIEYQGKKIDISLTKTSQPDIAPSGALLILDYVVEPGKVQYTYWREIPAEAAQALEEVRASSAHNAKLVAHKEAEHKYMQKFAAAPDGPAQYMRIAPANVGYDFLAAQVTPLLAKRLPAGQNTSNSESPEFS